MRLKKYLSAVLALTLASAAASCGKTESTASTSEEEDFSFVETVEVAETTEIENIPEGEPSELEWFSYFDLNPTRASPEKSTNLALFEQKGGTIKYTSTTSLDRYTDLATRLMSNDPPDMFWYEQGMTFPANCIQGMFQPIDSIVDFDSALWSGVKDTADQYVLKGEHYVAPINFGALSVITYDRDVIEANNLDDPYELYEDGEWDWNAWYDIMDEYVSGAEEGKERFGINGWFAPFFYHSTGKTLIAYDADKEEYVSNINDPDLERAAQMLYDIQKNNLYLSGWYGSAQEAFAQNVLFYAMGSWAVNPEEGDNWAIVPMPRDPNSDVMYTSLDVNAYMWVKGSQKDVAMKTWLECSRLAETGEEYVETAKEKFYVNQPYWTEEMYQTVNSDVLSDKFVRFFDPGYAITPVLSDDNAATTPTKEAVVAYMYSSVMKTDEDGAQYSWAQLREMYSATIDAELADFNKAYKEFLAKE